jgi:Subtilase family
VNITSVRRRLALAVTIFTPLALLSCGSDENAGGTTGASSASTETTEETTTTATPITDPDPNHPECYYRKDLVLLDMPTTEAKPPPEDLQGDLDLLTKDELIGLLDDTAEISDGDEAGIDELLNVVAAYQVTSGGDPLALAQSLSKDLGVDASPVLLTTVTVHWTYAPGGPHVDGQSPPQDIPDTNFVSHGTVGVVDTGYSPTNSQMHAWLDARVEQAAGSEDEEVSSTPPTIQGHGRFVASIIAQQAPDTSVVVAGMANLDPNIFYGELPPEAPKGFTSDELQMFLGIHELLAKPKDYKALNLSVGTYQCSLLSDSGLAVRAAVDRWLTAMEKSPIIAAAGNHDPSVQQSSRWPRFIPAAYAAEPAYSGRVLSVQSMDAPPPSGTTPVPSNFSNKSNVSAIGKGLVGVRLDNDWTAWSGSSFATAVVTGELAANGSLPAATGGVTVVPLAPGIEHV